MFWLDSQPSFEWQISHEQRVRSVLHFLHLSVTRCPFSSNINSVLVSNALSVGNVAAMGQNEKAVSCTSSGLSKTEFRIFPDSAKQWTSVEQSSLCKSVIADYSR